MKVNRLISAFVLFSLALIDVYALSAKEVVKEASQYKTVSESVSYLKKTLPKLSSDSERRSVYAFLGGVQEQLGNYLDAQKSYAAAAAIDAGDSAGMPKKSSEQLVIDAVRCALSLGDYVSADRYLSSAVKDSKNEKIVAYRNLYSQWSLLCRSEGVASAVDVVRTLKSYADSESMKVVCPQILLTLHHITGDAIYAKRLKSEYPNSMETGIVQGKVSVLPTPFWYFVPRSEFFDNTVGSHSSESSSAASNSSKEKQKNTGASFQKSSGTVVKLQLGLFRDEVNAKHLVDKLKKNGFIAQIDTEVRPSGTTYYLVYVRENETCNMADLLRSAGYDCYPLFE